MTDFKGGGIPVPDYDKEDINFVSQKTEFTDDVFVYGKLYAEFGGDVQTFSTGGKERVRILSNGKVGINTDIPSRLLNIDTTGTSTEGIVVKSLDNTYPKLEFGANRTNADAFLGMITASWDGTSVADILFETGSDTTNKDDGLISFRTSSSGGTREERLRITQNGDVTIQSGDFIIGSTSGGFSFVNSSSTPDADSTSSTRVIKDYDEGTCDWELHRSDGLTTGNPGTNSIVTYTKIGNRVFMSGYVRTHTTGSSTGVNAVLTDASGNAASLPYTPNHSGGMPISHTRTIDEFERMSVSFASGSKTVYVHTDESNNDYTPNQNDVTISSTQTHLVIAFTGSYTTDE